MSSGINVSLDNPYGQVIIPRAKLRPASGGDGDVIIANPAAFGSKNTGEFGANGSGGVAPPPPYMVKEEEETGGQGCPTWCCRCRRK